MPPTECFHCGEAVALARPLTVAFDGADRPVCCAGCQAVADLIIESGQGDYYRYREGTAARVDEQLLFHLSDWDAFDADQPAGEQTREALIALGGMHCAACGWLVERHLARLPGVESVRADFQQRQLLLRWNVDRVALSDLLRSLVRLGYRPRPVAQTQAGLADERRQAIRRLGVAGLGMMQVMMYAVGTYFGLGAGLDPAMERLLHLVSLTLTSGVLAYSGQPFLLGAWRSLRSGLPTMDLPVALALVLAWGASCFNLARDSGAVYFESVTMFIFFLLLGRFVEMTVRHRGLNLGEALGQVLPETARRLESGTFRSVPRGLLQPGDEVAVRVGDAFPADGTLLSDTEVDESLLCGEARPRPRSAGEQVRAGSINLGQPVTIAITATGDALYVSQLQQLLRRARAQRPVDSERAERGAAALIVGVLLLSAAVYVFWSWHGGVDAFEAALAVLVVTCPCALSLAAPSALAALGGALARRGLLVLRTDALLKLASADRVLFDKTGTLTEGRPRVVHCRIDQSHPRPIERDRLLAMVAAAERGIAHPLARAFECHDVGLEATSVQVQSGRGVAAQVAGRKLLITRPPDDEQASTRTEEAGASKVVVRDDDGVLARIELVDGLRAGTTQAVAALARRGLKPAIVSGDMESAVAEIARRSGIASWRSKLLPEEKLELMRTLQASGRQVLAVGDGVNDAPLLAGADVSVAMAGGAGLAQCGADLLLTRSLGELAEAVDAARHMRTIVRQNLAWAAVYNLVAVPLAAAGLVAPWLAAVGMSFSSLVVVLNATRAARLPETRRTEPLPAGCAA